MTAPALRVLAAALREGTRHRPPGGWRVAIAIGSVAISLYVLYVGAFAFIINNFRLLADIIFASFAGLGLVATGSPITAAQLMQPGFVADTGYQAAYPLLGEANALLGFPSFFSNFVTIAIILLAWLIVLFAFFILAIQLFVTIIEFKLTTLAGFVLVPFALWNKTSFLAERVLGNVMASGVKLMVLAIIVGIGTALADDPLLTARPPGPRTPARIVLDTHGRLPATSRLLQTAAEAPVRISVW